MAKVEPEEARPLAFLHMEREHTKQWRADERGLEGEIRYEDNMVRDNDGMWRAVTTSWWSCAYCSLWIEL